MSPLEAYMPQNQQKLKEIYRINNTRHKVIPKFKLGEAVRISRQGDIFSKGFVHQWSPEIFNVYAINAKAPATYLLKDFNGEILTGSFYEAELQRVKDPTVFLIEKILQKKGDKIKVKFLGYKETQWISKSDIVADK